MYNQASSSSSFYWLYIYTFKYLKDLLTLTIWGHSLLSIMHMIFYIIPYLLVRWLSWIWSPFFFIGPYTAFLIFSVACHDTLSSRYMATTLLPSPSPLQALFLLLQIAAFSKRPSLTSPRLAQTYVQWIFKAMYASQIIVLSCSLLIFNFTSTPIALSMCWALF